MIRWIKKLLRRPKMTRKYLIGRITHVNGEER
jgi:hypothetical protein